MDRSARYNARNARREWEEASNAITKQNAASSPLLRLPGEIQREIFTHVVGGNMIHIDLVMGDTKPFDLTRCVCQVETSEATAYQESILGSSEVPRHEDPIYWVEDCGSRHPDCSARTPLRPEGSETSGHPGDDMMRPSLLSVCRQTYHEGFHCFWATNTFNFMEPEAFRLFLAHLNRRQKKLLSHFHIELNLRDDWDPVTTPRLLKQLPRLKCLDIYVEILALACDVATYDHPLWDPILRFQPLPLKTARVILADSADLFFAANADPEIWEDYAMENGPFLNHPGPVPERMVRFT
ncbi:MAG: hypothetical protein LQ352_007967, partial [Teloschistes flavicans]